MSAHLLVDDLDSLQGPHHDAELDDPAHVVAPDDVDPVHVLAFHARLELEDRGVPERSCFVYRNVPPAPPVSVRDAASRYCVVTGFPRGGV
jgi:hypothetical protein